MTLQELKNQPKHVRVLASTYASIKDTRAMIGCVTKVYAEDYFHNTVTVWSVGVSEMLTFNRSDVQFLTPVEFNGKRVGIGDGVFRNGEWYTVYDYSYRDGQWVLACVQEGGELRYSCRFIYQGNITDHRPLQIADPAKLKWQAEMERLKEEGRKNGWE